MNVTLTEKDSKKVVATYSIHISGQNYVPTEDEYFSSAWKNAVDDGVVEDNKRDKHIFTLED